MIGLSKPYGISYINLKYKSGLLVLWWCKFSVKQAIQTKKNYKHQWWRARRDHTPLPTQALRRALVIPRQQFNDHLLLNWTRSETWMQTFPPLVRTSILDSAESSQLHSPLPHVVLEGLCWSGGLPLGPQRDALQRTRRRTAFSWSAPVCSGTSPGARNLCRALSCHRCS